MAQMNAGIILAGQQPDFVNVLANANQAAAQQNGFQRENQLNALYRDQGAQIAQGDQGALNALAGFDPKAALGIQGARLGMDATRQGMRINDEELDLRKQAAAQSAQAFAIKLSEAERAKQAEQIKRGLMAAGQAFDAGDEAGFNQILQQFGVDPFPMQEFPYKAAEYAGVLDALEKAGQFGQGPKPADEYQRYVQEEQAAGRPVMNRIEYAQAKKGEGVSMTMPDGTVVRVGGAAQQGKMAPSSPTAMLDTIDGILNDPALDSSTGILAPLQNVPGTPMKRFQGRANQLNGQAFLQAFESLKGAGQITEIEGTKATQAIGRLDTAQAPEDYRDALLELRTILYDASQRPEGWAAGKRSEVPQAPASMPGNFGTELGNLPDGITPQSVWDAMSEEGKALWGN